MKYFLDTEFYENGVTIDLISIGIVAEDGREFYACSTDARLHEVSPWVREHVLPQLPLYSDAAWLHRKFIARRVESFISVPTTGSGHFMYSPSADDPRAPDRDAEFWAYFADYDWVVFCQLFGTMINLPLRFPRYCMDLKQWAKQLNVHKGLAGWPKQESGEHNALADARWNKELYAYISAIETGRRV
jgi:hypothetical protein